MLASAPAYQMENDLEWHIAQERLAVTMVRDLAKQMVPYAEEIWQWGDGCGGAVLEMITQTFAACGLTFEDLRSSTPKGRNIPQGIRTLVYERDEYACRHCGVRKNLTLDHVIPRSKGGSDHESNLQTLCRGCNSRKGDRLE